MNKLDRHRRLTQILHNLAPLVSVPEQRSTTKLIEEMYEAPDQGLLLEHPDTPRVDFMLGMLNCELPGGQDTFSLSYGIMLTEGPKGRAGIDRAIELSKTGIGPLSAQAYKLKIIP